MDTHDHPLEVSGQGLTLEDFGRVVFHGLPCTLEAQARQAVETARQSVVDTISAGDFAQGYGIARPRLLNLKRNQKKLTQEVKAYFHKYQRDNDIEMTHIHNENDSGHECIEERTVV